MTLTFDQWLGIAGLVAGIAGVAVGVGYGIKLDQKLKSARSAKKQIEKKFMHFMAAQEFDALALKASVIMRDIRRGQWAAVPATADELAILLGQARGARNPLLQSLEKDQLDVAVTNIKAFIASLPLEGREGELAAENRLTMLSRCQGLVDAASEIAGRLRVESIQESGE